jgi:hypothetical protein
MTKKEVCESKIRYKSVIAVEYVIDYEHKNCSQDYYKCEICNGYHIFTLNKRVSNKRDNKIKVGKLSSIIGKKRKRGKPRRKK